MKKVMLVTPVKPLAADLAALGCRSGAGAALGRYSNNP